MSHSEYSWKYEKEVNNVHGDFDDPNAGIIVSVAKKSPAEKIGLKEGDYIVSLNGKPVLAQDELELTASSTTDKYQFYSYLGHALINVEIDPIPLGIIMEPSSKSLLKELKDGGFPGWEGFRLLWQRREWENLLAASDTLYSDSLLSCLIRKVFKKYGEGAGILYKGAALFELNRQEQSIALISTFIENHLSDYETHEHAIAYFYAAKWAEFMGHIEETKSWLIAADRSNAGEFERISQEVYLKDLEPLPDKYLWKSKHFPCHYALESIDKSGIVSLSESLSKVGNDQLLPVCVMPSYRGNGPYNDAMGCYGSLYKYISKRILPMHIILDNPDKVEGEEWRYEVEDVINQYGVPFKLLHDSERSVADALELEYSPVFYLLNRSGAVVYEGPLRRAFDYWTVLESMSGALPITHEPLDK